MLNHKFIIAFSIFLSLFLVNFCVELKKPFELNDFLKGTYVNRNFNATWISGDTLIFMLNTDNNVYRYNVNNKEKELLFTADVLKDYPGASFLVSDDEEYVLIRHNQQAIFRHSTTAQYTVCSIKDGKYYPLQDKKHIQTAKWSPKGKGLVYIYENNIYHLEDPIKVTNPKKITNDGIPGIIYNGVPDWVYEEEVLGTGSALWFSPDGNYLAFAHFNDTNVKEYSYYLYGKPGSIKNQYPQTVTIRYPKAGEINPKVALKVVDLTNDDKGKTLFELDENTILFDVTWANKEEVVSVLMNRVQNKLHLSRCSFQDCVKENYEWVNDKGWIDNPAPLYNDAGSKFVVVISQPEEDDSYKHLVLIDSGTKEMKRLTRGKRIVSGCLGWDTSSNNIYYVGSVENKPSQQQVYVVNAETLNDKCITCDFATPEGLCKYSIASFSKDFSHYVKLCQGPGPNFITINNVSKLSEIMIWENNTLIRQQMSSLLQPIIKDVKIDLKNGFTANARLLLPPNFDENNTYPMIVNVYGGPNSNQISDVFSVGFQNYIVTNHNYIYAYIDGRGSGRRGDNLLFQIYRRLATVEIEDQIYVTKYLQENFSFIDRNRTGIWGWSYGGFATAWVLVKDVENRFKFGLSVAPVTDFIYYDSIYTERYMGIPTSDDNELGYNNTDITRHVSALKNKLFFLIHGNADDNVHYQQSMLLAKALEEADVQFEQLSYPDENHSLQHVYPHLYHSIDRFWARSFGFSDPEIKKL